MDQSLVQILVVVANIQIRSLKTEVGKGSMATVVVHRLIDPKELANAYQNKKDTSVFDYFAPKGNPAEILEFRCGEFKWQHGEFGDIMESTGKSYLFYLTFYLTMEAV